MSFCFLLYLFSLQIEIGFLKSFDYCIEKWPMNHGRAFYSIFSMTFQYVIPIITVTVVSTYSHPFTPIFSFISRLSHLSLFSLSLPLMMQLSLLFFFFSILLSFTARLDAHKNNQCYFICMWFMCYM